jgi:hypothetical protein
MRRGIVEDLRRARCAWFGVAAAMTPADKGAPLEADQMQTPGTVAGVGAPCQNAAAL